MGFGAQRKECATASRQGQTERLVGISLGREVVRANEEPCAPASLAPPPAQRPS